LVGEELIRVLRNRLIERSEMGRREELIRVLRSMIEKSKNLWLFTCLISDEIRQEGVFQNSLCFIRSG
jgi:hypothetical protein